MHTRVVHLDEIIGMPINQKQVGITIVIIIKEAQSPTAKKLRGRCDFARLIRKGEILLIVIKTEKLLLDICDEQVLPSIPVVVCRIDAHSGPRFS